MKLKFFGRGSGFTDSHTSACFSTQNNELVLLDCPMSTFQKLRCTNLRDYDNIYVLITHTHGDHISGLGLFAQYMFFVQKKHLIIIAPSLDVSHDIATLLTIEGNNPSWYKLMTTTDIEDKNWFITCILTAHSPQLKGKCFGYQLYVDNVNIVYTGDTSALSPFIPYLSVNSELYIDTSVYYGEIHLKLEDALDDFIELTKKGINVYLMHLDDIDAADKIVKNISNIEIVSLYSFT